MADLTITAASIVPVAGYQSVQRIAGEDLTAGLPVYIKESDNKFWKADADASAAAAAAVGITLHAALTGQPCNAIQSGDLGMGAILTKGYTYCVSDAAGLICPDADIETTGDYKTILGVASSTSNLKVHVYASGAFV